MEDLNKTQMVLLCLLVSFVTSIGTGVITTSLLREVPQNVTQTINRVVERTVQTIGPTTPNTVTKEVTTVVVKEEDLIIDSINKSRGSLVRIMNNKGVMIGLGIVVKNDGTILADKRSVAANGSYSAVFSGAAGTFPLSVVATSGKTNAIFLKPVFADAAAQASKTFTSVKINSADKLQLGQTVIAVGGKEKEAVAIGRINSINQDDSQAGSATSTKIVSSFETDTPLRDLTPGSILLNLNGQMVGFEDMNTAANQENLYTAIGLIQRESPSFFEAQ